MRTGRMLIAAMVFAAVTLVPAIASADEGDLAYGPVPPPFTCWDSTGHHPLPQAGPPCPAGWTDHPPVAEAAAAPVPVVVAVSFTG